MSASAVSGRSQTTCGGGTAEDDCGAPAVYEVSRQAGPGRTRERYACGRHIARLLRYMTVPGESVTVTHLKPSDDASPGATS